jgi:hypothetical protein
MDYMYFYDLGGRTDDQSGNQTAVGGQQLTGIQPSYWSGTGFDSGDAWFFCFACHGFYDEGVNDFRTSAWAVRVGDVGAVPEPATLLLIGVGMLGLVWHSRRR